MHTFLQDVRFAFRRMARSPAFTAVAFLSLGVGIGTNTAVFTLVESFLFPRLPYPAPEELVEVYLGQEAFPFSPLSYPDYRDVREGTRGVFSEMGTAGYAFGQVETNGRTTGLFGEMVSGTYFPTLGMGAALGRTILPEDDLSRGGHPVLMIGHGYWQREFDGDPGVLGRVLVLNGRPFTIIGVVHPDYAGAVRAEGVSLDFIAPISMANEIMQASGDVLDHRDSQSYFVKARLAPGVGLEEARARLDAVAAELRQTFPDVWDGARKFIPIPSEEVVMNPAMDGTLVSASGLALALVGIVLLIACANLASFLLARGTDRRKEIAMRLALGARRWTLVRQLLTETMVLGIGGGILGMGISAWLLSALVRMDLPLPGDIQLEVGMTAGGYLFGLGATLLAGVLFGLAPALQSTNPDVAPTLKDEGTGGGRPRRFSMRNILVAGQVAASFILLIVSGLLLRSFQARQSVDPGFHIQSAALLTFAVSSDRYEVEEGRLFIDEYLRRLREQPGVVDAGVVGNFHLTTTSTFTMDLNVPGVPPPEGRRVWEVDQSQVDPGFFRAAGIPILRGRNFTAADEPDGQPVAIVNQVFAERFWPGENPIGKVVQRENGQLLEVVGLARSTKVRTLGENPRPFIYTPYSQRYTTFLTAFVRGSGSSETALGTAYELLRAMDPQMVVMESKTVEEHLGVQLLPARLGAVLAGLFAAVALTLASIGLYGVVSYSVARRSRDMGIRMSLGAAPNQVVRHVLKEGLFLVAVGAGAGMALALAGGQILQGFLFNVEVLDPVTFLGVPLFLLAVTLIAAYLPARRASRVDPVKALRAE